MLRKQRQWIFRIGLVFGSLAFSLAILELGFRTVLPASEMPFVRYLSDYQILALDPSVQQSGVYTLGLDARIRGRWQLNPQGWNSSVDYSEPRRGLRVAIVGDSYVEALQVNQADSFPEKLRTLLEADCQVFQFGVSGANLADYLRMVRYVNAEFSPDTIIVNLVRNDFELSLAEQSSEGSYRSKFAIRDGTVTEVSPVPYEPQRLRRLAGHSAVVRYLVFNAEFRGWMQPKASSPEASARQAPRRPSKLENQLQSAIRYAFATLAGENVSRRVIVVLDADRSAIYQREPPNPRYQNIAEEVQASAFENGIEFINLHSVMDAVYAREPVRFEFETDSHWNARAHALVAETLFERCFANAASQTTP